jgi:hypothetical protein
VSELVKKARGKFRSAKGISDDKYLIFINPGNTVEKVDFSFKAFKRGLKEFLEKDQIKSINKDHFEILLSVPSDEVHHP